MDTGLGMEGGTNGKGLGDMVIPNWICCTYIAAVNYQLANYQEWPSSIINRNSSIVSHHFQIRYTKLG